MNSFALPPNPAGIRSLSDVELHRLREQHPDLPRTPADCVTCTGSGSFRWYGQIADGQDGRNVVDYTCDCDGQFLLHRYLLHSGLGKLYQRLRWDDVTDIPDDVVDTIGDYAERIHEYVAAGVGLLLWGQYGTGKTLLAALLLKQILANGVRGHFTTFHDMLDAFTEGWSTPEARRWFNYRVRHAGILVIDDVGREYSGRNAVAETAIDHVLRSRIQDAKPTIITTNKTPDELSTLYSGQAFSLVSGSSIVREFRGADFRKGPQLQRVQREIADRVVRPIAVG